MGVILNLSEGELSHAVHWRVPLKKQTAAAPAVDGNKSPAAPTISRSPVIVTMRSGRGKAAGVIRMRSGLRFPQ